MRCIEKKMTGKLNKSKRRKTTKTLTRFACVAGGSAPAVSGSPGIAAVSVASAASAVSVASSASAVSVASAAASVYVASASASVAASAAVSAATTASSGLPPLCVEYLGDTSDLCRPRHSRDCWHQLGFSGRSSC
jgi:hypothetical protein